VKTYIYTAQENPQESSNSPFRPLAYHMSWLIPPTRTLYFPAFSNLNLGTLRAFKVSFSTMPPSQAHPPLATPRPSASLIVVNAKNEVLLVHRNPKATSFSGMHV
jgi:hypothetical protein